MQFLTTLAEKIVEEATHVLAEDIIITNKQAVVIAASVREKVGSTYSQAKIVLKEDSADFASDGESLEEQFQDIVIPIHYQAEIIGVIGIAGPTENTKIYILLLKRFTELIIQQIQAAEINSSKWRAFEGTMHEIFRTNDWSEALKKKAVLLGIKQGRKYTLALMESAKEEPGQIPYPELSEGVMLTKWGEYQYLILIAAEDKEEVSAILKTLFDYFTLQNVAIYKTGVSTIAAELSVLYQEAESALKYSNKDTVYFDDLSIELILNDLSASTKRKLMKDTAGFREEELFHTLQCYIANDLSLKVTAEMLHIHVNTLHYRLKKIEQLTGYSCKKTEDLVLLYLSIKLKEKNEQEQEYVLSSVKHSFISNHPAANKLS